MLNLRFPHLTTFLAGILILSTPVFADGPLDGHWQGNIRDDGHDPENPLSDLPVTIVFETSDAISGTISIPRLISEYPLATILLDGMEITFEVPGFPGAPHFAGTLDGASLTGHLIEGERSYPVELARLPDQTEQ